MTELSKESIEQNLRNLLVPDTNTIKIATQYIKKALEYKESVKVFVEIIVTSPDNGLRQTAAVVIRRFFWDLIKDLELNIAEEVKAALLQALVNEHIRPIRKAVANLVLEVAKNSAEKWIALLEYIDLYSTNEEEEKRADGSYILMVLLEDSPEIFDGLYGVMLPKITQKLTVENNPDIISHNIKSLFSISACLEPEEVGKWKDVFKLVLTKCKALLECGEEEKIASICFSLTDNLDPNYCPNTTSLYKKADLDLVVQFATWLIKTDSFSMNTREAGLNIIETLVSSRRKYFKKKEAITPVIENAYYFATLRKPEDYDSEPYEYAMGILDCIANNLNPQDVFNVCIKYCTQLMTNELPVYRLVGFYSIGVISEGCQEQMRANLTDILNQMVKGFEDPDINVRAKSFVSLGYLCEFCIPEICDHCASVIPYIVKALQEDSNSDTVKEKILFSLQSFVESMNDDKLLPYVEMLFDTLIAYMQSVHNTKCKKEALKAISCVLTEAGKKSVKYYEQLFLINKSIILGRWQTEDDQQVLACAITCMSNLIYNMDEELQKNALNSIGDVNNTILGLLKNNFDTIIAEVKEAVYEWCSTLIQIMHQEFTILGELWGLVFKSAEQEDIVIGGEEDEGDDNLMKTEDEDAKYKGMNIRTNNLDEKAAALHFMGCAAEYIPLAFYPYREQMTTLLKDHCNGYFHENIRMQTAISWAQVAIGLARKHYAERVAANMGQDVNTLNFKQLYTQKYNFTSMDDYGQDCLDIINSEVIGYITLSITTDDSMEVVSRCFDALRELVDNLGKHWMTEDIMGELFDAMRVCMDGDAFCQCAPDEDGLDDEETEVDEEERFEHDSKLLGFVTECLSSFCKILGEDVGPHFDTYFKESVEKRAKPGTTMDDKMYVAGVLCDFWKYAPIYMTKYHNESLALCELFLKDTNECVKRNTAFLLALLCEAGRDNAGNFYNKVCMLLEPLLSAKPETKDNAYAALARMIMSNEQCTPNAEQVTLAICSNAPFYGDYAENATLIKFFLYLSKKYAAFASNKIDVIYNTCNLMCEEKEKNSFEDAKQDMIELVQVLNGYNLGEKFINNVTIKNSLI